jgi:hypothetical protein
MSLKSNELKEGNKLIGSGQSKVYSENNLMNLLLDGAVLNNKDTW